MSIDNIKEYIDDFGIFGEPVEYKGVNLYPITVQNAFGFERAIELFCVEKNRYEDIEIIQMSYLFFMLMLMEINPELTNSFVWICENIMHIYYDENLRVQEFPKGALISKLDDKQETTIILLNGYEVSFEVKGRKATIFFGDKRFTATDFDELKRIILYQNINEYDDTPMSDDVRRVVEKYRALKNKGIKPPTLEDKMLAVLVGSNETRETIKSMPYRQFVRLFDLIVGKTEYETTKPLIPYMDKKEVEHWIYRLDKNKFDGIFSDAESVGKAKVVS